MRVWEYFFKSRGKLFPETESTFQLKMSNDDDVEREALRRETLSAQGRFSTRTVQATPARELERCLSEQLT